MAWKIPLRDAWLRLRQSSPVEERVAQHGPTARRVPRVLRERAVRQSAIAALPQARTWSFTPEREVSASTARRPRGSRTSAPFVARIEGAWLVGRHATPWTAQGRMLLSPFLDRLSLLGLDEHADLESWARGKSWSREPDGEAGAEGAWGGQAVCSLVGRLDLNYFHWIIDICGQLEALAAYREQTGEEPRILIRAGCPPFVRQSLELLGYPASRLLEWPLLWAPGQGAPGQGASSFESEFHGVPLARRVGRLVVPSWRNYARERPPRSLLWLRRTFLQAAGVWDSAKSGSGGDGSNVERRAVHAEPHPSGARLYLHRAPGGWRSVQNGDEVCAFLEARGFEIVRAERLSQAEQMRLLVGARALVGIHGAALTGVLFAPRAHLVELAGSYGGLDYGFIARSLGNAYTRVSCATRGDNIVVDLRRLGHAIQSLE